MSNLCMSNNTICDYANNNGYCCVSACLKMELFGNTIQEEKSQSKWHTGTPTEEGWYLCKSEHMVGYDVGYYVNGRFNRLHCFNQEDITVWQKIEP